MSSPQRLSARTLICSAFGALMLSSTVMAASAADSTSIEAQYKRDVANCNSGKTNQAKQVCLQEAGAARVEARRNNLTSSSGGYQQNAMQRCQRLPASDKAACEAQMAGQGQTYGSVQGGGVLREMTIQVPAGTPGAMPAQPQGYSQGMAPAPRPAPGMAPPPPAPGMARPPAPMAPPPMPAPAQTQPPVRY